MRPDDEPAFLQLLGAVYGETYAHRGLYDAGAYAAWVARPDVVAFGDFADDETLYSHTALLFKDPRREYAESGLSMRDPSKRGASRMPDEALWPLLAAALGPEVAWLHQNTSTAHLLAQRYARRHLAARPAGLIVRFTVGERLRGAAESPAEMHALAMSSRLTEARRAVRLPSHPWAPWLAERLALLGREVDVVSASWADHTPAVETFEENVSLSLRRRVVRAAGDRLDGVSRFRTELVHLPLDARAASFSALCDAGFVPVGVRAHARRPDEVVFQALDLKGDASLLGAVRGARCLGDDAEGLVASWVARCERAL